MVRIWCVNFVKDAKIRNLIYSFDTMSWMYPSTKFGRVVTFTGRRMVKLHTKGPKDPERRVKLADDEIQWLTLRGYCEYYNYLCKKWERQKTLD